MAVQIADSFNTKGKEKEKD